MPAPPSDEEIRDVGARVAESALEHAAGNRHALVRFAHDHFPDHDPYEHRIIAGQLRDQLMNHAQLVYQRRRRLEAKGTMRPPGQKESTPGGDADRAV